MLLAGECRGLGPRLGRRSCGRPLPAGASSSSGGVGPAHAAPALRGALVLVQTAPRAVLLGPGDGVVKAVGPHGAAHADLLGLTLTDLTLGLALTVRAEEEHEVFPPARSSVLPTPARAGKVGLPTYL